MDIGRISYQVSSSNPFCDHPAHHRLRKSVDAALNEWESLGNSKRALKRIESAYKKFVKTLSPTERENFLSAKTA